MFQKYVLAVGPDNVLRSYLNETVIDSAVHGGQALQVVVLNRMFPERKYEIRRRRRRRYKSREREKVIQVRSQVSFQCYCLLAFQKKHSAFFLLKSIGILSCC